MGLAAGTLGWAAAQAADSPVADGNGTANATVSPAAAKLTAASPGAATGNATAPDVGMSEGGLPLPDVSLVNPAATAGAATAVIPEPDPMPADSPERHTQDALRAYLAEEQPKRLDALNTLKFDRTQITDRMDMLTKTGAADELVDTYLYYLTAYAPDPKNFLDVMTRLAVLLNDRGTDGGLLTLLFRRGSGFRRAGRWRCICN